MKNKRIILIILVVLVAIGGLSSMLFLLQKLKVSKAPDVGTFDLTKYQWEIKNFPSVKNVGQVNNKNVAIEKAKSLWLEKYGSDNGQLHDFVKERKIVVDYDAKEECWHIYGTLPTNTVGGVPHVIVKKTAKCLLFGLMTEWIIAASITDVIRRCLLGLFREFLCI